MARYIDADKFRQELIFKQLYCRDDIAERHALGVVIAELDGTPTADVVPKSEYDSLKKLFNDMTQEAKGYLNRLYGIRADVAREIFEEVERTFNAVLVGDISDILKVLAELKKKYIGE